MIPIVLMRLVALFALEMSGALAAQTAPLPVPAPRSPDKIKEQAARCGVPVARVTIRSSRELREDVIAVASGPPLTGVALACVARVSLAASTYVEFDESEQQKRYNAVYQRIEDIDNVTGARAWLDTRGLLTKLPRYDPARQSLAAYGRELEAVCGIRRGTVLTAIGAMLTLRRELLAPSAREPTSAAMTDDQFGCLLNASTASNLREHGAGFGFAGRESAPVN